MTASAEEPSSGAVFVATGPKHYAVLAARAAESLKRHNPGLAVDLFTDAPHELPVFDQIHGLESPWLRSKIDALLNSRFERTLYLDSDVVVVADVGDIFEVLDRFDVALTHDQQRNGHFANVFWRRELPPAFPQFSGGLLAVRRSAATQRMLEDWAAAVRAHDTGRDQPALREVLWESDLRIATLPEEYNLMRFHTLPAWDGQNAAPRIIHSPQFHREFDRYMKAADPVTERLGLKKSMHLRMLLAGDQGLARRAGREPRQMERAERLNWMLHRLPGRLLRRLQRIAAR